MRTWRLDVDSDAHAPHLARHSLAIWLAHLDCTDNVRSDVILLASELVTNAVTTNATAVSIRVLFDDGRLRMDVHAQGHNEADRPTTGPDPQRQSLSERVTDAVADNWGHRREPEGMILWAEVLC